MAKPNAKIPVLNRAHQREVRQRQQAADTHHASVDAHHAAINAHQRATTEYHQAAKSHAGLVAQLQMDLSVLWQADCHTARERSQRAVEMTLAVQVSQARMDAL